MIKRRFAFLIPVFVLQLFLSSCNLSQVQEGQIVDAVNTQETDAQQNSQNIQYNNNEFGLPYQSGTPLNPYKIDNRLNLIVSRLIYEGLFQQGPDFTVKPQLCQSFVVAGNVWNIKIKQGVSFQSGGSLTSEDVKYSLDLARKSPLYAVRLKNILSVKTVGLDTVQITLKKEDGALDAKLCVPIIRMGEEDKMTPDGTGRYLVLQNQDGSAKLKAFSNWHGNVKLPFDEILLIPIKKQDMISYGFETSEIDAVAESKLGEAAASYRGDAEAHSYATSQMVFLGVNTQKAPLSDPNVRAALAMAIDRQSLAKQELSSLIDPCNIPYNTAGLNATVSGNLIPDVQGAIQKLQSSGLNKGLDGILTYQSGFKKKTFTIEIICNNENSYMVSIANSLSHTFDDLGIQSTVSELDYNEYQTRINKNNFDIYIGRTQLPTGFELDAFLAPGGALNKSYYSNPELLTLY
ncbi:MAG: ABC transporter substrate-binding protein, partial [Clostridiales bacterium]|nr:ABC transporter substrate-binding protein [Clostridiales bacterium]